MIQKIVSKARALVKDGFLHILSGSVITKSTSFVTSIIIARYIAKNEYANLAYADNLYQYITYLSGMGLASALLKYIKPNGPEADNNTYRLFAQKAGMAFDFILVLLLLVLTAFIEIPFPESRRIIMLMSGLPLLTFMMTSDSSYFRAKRKNKLFARLGATNGLISMLLCLLLARTLGVSGVIIARYAAVLVVVLISRALIYRSRETHEHGRLDTQQKKGIIAMGLSMMVAALFSNIIQLNESFFINNMLADPVITANFRVASLLPAQLGIFSFSIIVYYFSIIANMDDYTAILKKLKEVQLVTMAFILSVGVLGILTTPLIIRWFYGAQYADAVELSYVVWVIRIVNILVRTVPMQLLPALGKLRFSVIVNAASVVLHALLSYLFIQSFGVYGIVYSAVITYTLSGAGYWIYFIRVCKQGIARGKVRGEDQ